jgi:hypothetical protein
MTDMQAIADAMLIKFSVQQAIFCPDCDRVLDMHDAVHTEAKGRHGIACGACFDQLLGRLADKTGAPADNLEAKLRELGVEIHDGREIDPLTFELTT